MSREFTEKHKKELETKIAKARKALEEYLRNTKEGGYDL